MFFQKKYMLLAWMSSTSFPVEDRIFSDTYEFGKLLGGEIILKSASSDQFSECFRLIVSGYLK